MHSFGRKENRRMMIMLAASGVLDESGVEDRAVASKKSVCCFGRRSRTELT